MKIEIGKKLPQKEGYAVFIPAAFPPKGLFNLPQKILIKAAEADRLIGKLDGITHTLPDVDFFLRMFVAKDAASSAQIEGTKATMVDAIEKAAGVATQETDADDILYYIQALNYGARRLQRFPLSLRLIREIHSQLMTGARATHFADPGEFRKAEMHRSLADFEKFLYNENETLPLIHIALSHAQFETIHPFLDGNGRTGRLLVTLLLCHRDLLERPVLFLSSYFKKHQKVYYSRLDGYHDGQVEEWLDFFLDGVIETANHSIEISKDIRKLRDEDMSKIQALAKRESASGIVVLTRLFADPIITSKTIMGWTGFTRAGAQKVIDRFVGLGILKGREQKGAYDRSYIYRQYVDVFVGS